MLSLCNNSKVKQLHPPLRIENRDGEQVGRLCAVHRGPKRGVFSYGLVVHHCRDGRLTWVGVPLREFSLRGPLHVLLLDMPNDLLETVPGLSLSHLPPAQHLCGPCDKDVWACIRARLRTNDSQRELRRESHHGPVRAPAFDPEATTIYSDGGFNALLAASVCCS